MKYCENGDHRWHARPMLVERLNGDSGWKCNGAYGYGPAPKKRKRKVRAASDKTLVSKKDWKFWKSACFHLRDCKKPDCVKCKEIEKAMLKEVKGAKRGKR